MLRHPLAVSGSQEPLERAILAGDTNAIEAILKSDRALASKPFRGRQTPLALAVICNNPKPAIDLLIAYGADINARGDPFNTTPLQNAAWAGKLESVKALLAHHPDVNAANDNAQSGTGDGSTALNFALVGNNKEIFSLLIEAGADLNRGRSVLAQCMGYASGRDSWAEYILSKGADPNRFSPKADRFPPVIQAVLSGNTNYIGALIRHGVDLRARYLNGADNYSPLELAMNNDRLDIARMLQNYVLEEQSNTANFAAAHGDLNALRDLLQRNPEKLEEQDELGFTPLVWAAQAGQEPAAELLLSLGANPNAKNKGGRCPIDWAATAGHLPLVRLLAANSTNLNLTLFLAIQQQQVEVARFLLEHGANPNIHYPAGNGTMPLHLVARQGNVAAARLLMEHGAQINGLEQNNSTPLEYAVLESSKEMIDLLFANGATVPKHSNSWSIFQHWALGAGDTNVANVLLSHGADVKAKDYSGQTPLHFAAQQGQIQAVDWLLRNGASVNARNQNGKTPLGLLYQRRGRITRPDVAELLRKNGGRK
jgi:ankyrin repeat protein